MRCPRGGQSSAPGNWVLIMVDMGECTDRVVTKGVQYLQRLRLHPASHLLNILNLCPGTGVTVLRLPAVAGRGNVRNAGLQRVRVRGP